MNKQNFDTDSVSNYPLTINRMAELQEDLQAPMKVLASMLKTAGGSSRIPIGCILSGCKQAGDPGYVMLNINDGNGGHYEEFFEVEEGSGLANYLVLEERTITDENSDGQEIDVRYERVLVWAAEAPSSGVFARFASLPRLWVRQTPQDDESWTLCSGGSWWYPQLNGFRLRVKHDGGRVWLQGSVKFGLQIEQTIYYAGNAGDIANEHGLDRRTLDYTYTLPNAYLPAADVLVPIIYNGTCSYAVINSSGQLLLNQTPELGDTLEIDTLIDVL